jgi:hypothetical protein
VSLPEVALVINSVVTGSAGFPRIARGVHSVLSALKLLPQFTDNAVEKRAVA